MNKDARYKTKVNDFEVVYSKKLSKWVARKQNIEFSGNFKEVVNYCKTN
jgi:hypothetical protein